MDAKRDLRIDGQDGDRSGQRGFVLAPGETAEEFLKSRDEILRSSGIDPSWPGAAEIRRKLDAGELD